MTRRIWSAPGFADCAPRHGVSEVTAFNWLPWQQACGPAVGRALGEHTPVQSLCHGLAAHRRSWLNVAAGSRHLQMEFVLARRVIPCWTPQMNVFLRLV